MKQQQLIQQEIHFQPSKNAHARKDTQVKLNLMDGHAWLNEDGHQKLTVTGPSIFTFPDRIP